MKNKPTIEEFLSVSNYSSFVLKHREEDYERWYQNYKNKYPNFNKDEIVKMVREGILSD